MYSDAVHEAYMSIYDGIYDYKDYCEVQKNNTIKAMTHLNMILYAFDTGESKENYNRARSLALFDYNKAIQGIDYCEPPNWNA